MNRLFTLAFGIAAWLGAGAAPIFTTTLNTQEEFDLWETKDVNDDGSTWSFSPTNDEGKRTYYTYNKSNIGDDWLISPAISIPADGSYIVKYAMTGSSYGEAMDVALATSGTVEALAANIKKSHPEIKDTPSSGYFLFDANAGDTYYLGFHACSPADHFRLYLEGVTVEACDNPVDLAVVEITAPVSKQNLGTEENVTIKVKNELANPISGFDVTVSVDGIAAFTERVDATLGANEERDVTLTGTIDLSQTRRKYTVSATASAEGDVSTSNNTASAVVVNSGEATEPYFMGFESTDFTDGIKFFNLNNDSGDWSIETASFWMNLAYEGYGCLGYNYDKDNNADDWAILDGVKVDAGHHVLRFWVSGDDNHPERLSVHYGNEATPEAMTTELYRLDPFAQGKFQEIICIFELAEPQTIYIGFHAFSDKDENWIVIDNVSLDAISSTEADLSIVEVKTPGAFLTKEMPRDLVFTVKNIAIIDDTPTAKLTIDGTVVAEKPFTIKAQQQLDVTMENAFAGISEGTHEVRLEIVSEMDKKLENNSAEWQLTLLGEPDILYDFEDAAQLDELTFRAEDSGVLASDEFGETGWGLLAIQEHPIYGKSMLGGLTWFTDNAVKADRWCVFPQLIVNSPDAVMTLNAGSVSQIGGIEHFTVEVSKGDDKWYDYTRALTEDNLTTERGNYSVPLGDYNGKNVYVALHLQTVDGELASFDNIQFFGVAKAAAGIDEVSSDNALTLTMCGDTLVANREADIRAYDISGALVAAAHGSSLDLSTLPHGTFVVRAQCGGGSAVVKLVR